MTENDVIKIIRNYLHTQFPKSCSCCGKVYNSLEEYLRNTTHMGKPVSYDGDQGLWQPIKQIGTVSLANCLWDNIGYKFAWDGVGHNVEIDEMGQKRKKKERHYFKCSFRRSKRKN